MDDPAYIDAYIGLGSNLGDRAGNLLLGVRAVLGAGIHVSRLSSIYETEPVGVESEQPLFLNVVAEVKAGPDLTPELLLSRLLEIELSLGRRRAAPRAARTIDLDLLIYGKELRDNDLLVLPHPRMHERRFVLAPLSELTPDLRHPLLKRTIGSLLRDVSDRASVSVWQPGGCKTSL